MNEKREELRNENYRTLFRIRCSIRYHSRFSYFYENWNTITTALITSFMLISVSASCSAISKPTGLGLGITALLAGAIGGIIGTTTLAFGVAQKRRTHDDLKRRFIQIETLFNKEILDENELAKVKYEIFRIEESEPPILSLLNTLCFFEISLAEGTTKKIESIKWWRFLFMYFLQQTEYASTIHPEGEGKARSPSREKHGEQKREKQQRERRKRFLRINVGKKPVKGFPNRSNRRSR